MPANPQVDSVNGLPLFNLRRIPLDNVGNAFIKRTADIVCALLLIVLTSPLMLIAAIGVKLFSPGPIIFKQERVGKDKKPFYMYKFRSMKVNSSQNTGGAKTRTTADVVRLPHPQVLGGRAASVLQRAQGRYEPHRAQAGAAVLCGAVPE